MGKLNINDHVICRDATGVFGLRHLGVYRVDAVLPVPDGLPDAMTGGEEVEFIMVTDLDSGDVIRHHSGLPMKLVANRFVKLDLEK